LSPEEKHGDLHSDSDDDEPWEDTTTATTALPEWIPDETSYYLSPPGVLEDETEGQLEPWTGGNTEERYVRDSLNAFPQELKML